MTARKAAKISYVDQCGNQEGVRAALFQDGVQALTAKRVLRLLFQF